MSGPHRPVLRWHGGKWLLAPWIIGHFGTHRCYVEPFGGAASVLLRKERSHAEVYNDLDSCVVNLFRVLQDDQTARRLQQQLELTPFAREEFHLSYEASDDPVEDARRLIIRSCMGHGSDAASGHYRTGFRANSNRSGTTPARDWANYPAALEQVLERMRGVIIENRPAAQVMQSHDGRHTLHYVDPPYLAETRRRIHRRTDNGGSYRHELSDSDHMQLLQQLRTLQGMVVLSGYPSPSYDEALPGWLRVDRAALADGAKPRTECLWLNPAAQAAAPVGDLFEAA